MSPFLLLSLAAVEAPITQVTVFTDQARVVRTAQVQVNGTLALEFPTLRDSADVNSVRVEAQGAQVRRVDIERVTPEKLRTDEAKVLLAELDRTDAAIERAALERAALTHQRDALLRLTPTSPPSGAMQAPARLNASGWGAAASFSTDQVSKVQLRLRELGVQEKRLQEARADLLEKARKLGNPQVTSGWQITAQLAGSGVATVTLTYLVSAARWTPTWDLQLQPETNLVNLSLAGLVTQETGEDWTNATLHLSTAIPSRVMQLPKVATWKIGVADRFIPTPQPVVPPTTPPPPLQRTSSVPTEEELIRERLLRLGVPAAERRPAREGKRLAYEFSDEFISGEPADSDDAETERARPAKRPAPKKAPPPPPPSPPRALAESAPSVERDEEASYPLAVATSFRDERGAAQPATSFSLSPPPAWQPPRYGPTSPVTLAEGYDLAFSALQRETVPSGHGARRVALWSAQWPVTVERKLFPALTPDAFLIAELKNPSNQVLPGGPAQLSVGADPAGSSQLKLVSPGESFTLPLGIDRALKPVRNVQLVEATQGVFSKEEIGTYTVTIELANPYRTPIAVRVADQWPLSDQKEVETKLLETKPTAIQDQKKGGLEWRVTIPPQQKQVFSFSYTIKRPRGWQLQQQEVVR
jgi:hypothetical protein